MDSLIVMEWITILVTLLLFLCGIPPCVDMYKTGETKNVPYVLFLLSAVSCIGMLHYGLLLENSTLIFLNGVGTLLQITYVIMYLAVVKEKSRAVLYLLLTVAYFAAFYHYLYSYVLEPSAIEEYIGSSSGLVTAVLFTLPILEIIENVRYKNTDGVPLVMLLGMLACSAAWLIYGLMLNDANIYAPNIPGIVITLVKLYVIQLYGQSEKAKVA